MELFFEDLRSIVAENGNIVGFCVKNKMTVTYMSWFGVTTVDIRAFGNFELSRQGSPAKLTELSVATAVGSAPEIPEAVVLSSAQYYVRNTVIPEELSAPAGVTTCCGQTLYMSVNAKMCQGDSCSVVQETMEFEMKCTAPCDGRSGNVSVMSQQERCPKCS